MDGILAIQRYIGTQIVRCNGEMPYLVKLAVIRDVLFCHGADHFSAIDDYAAVIQLSADSKRHPDDRNDIQRSRFFDNPDKLCFGGTEQCILQKQVTAGIAGDGQLRKANYFDTLPVRFRDLFYDSVCIERTVCNLQIGGCAGNFDKTVFHNNPHSEKDKRTLRKIEAPLLVEIIIHQNGRIVKQNLFGSRRD